MRLRGCCSSHALRTGCFNCPLLAQLEEAQRAAEASAEERAGQGRRARAELDLAQQRLGLTQAAQVCAAAGVLSGVLGGAHLLLEGTLKAAGARRALV